MRCTNAGILERDVGVSQAAEQHDRDELPDDESWRHSDDQERRPHEHAASPEVDHVMSRTLERVQSDRRVMDGVRGPEPGHRMGEAMVPVLEEVTQDDHHQHLKSQRALRRPDPEPAGESQPGKDGRQPGQDHELRDVAAEARVQRVLSY